MSQELLWGRRGTYLWGKICCGADVGHIGVGLAISIEAGFCGNESLNLNFASSFHALAIHMAPSAVAARATRPHCAGVELHLRMLGRTAVFPLAEDFVAYVPSSEHREDDEHRAPWIDERSLAEWRARLREVIDEGAL